MSQGQRSKSIWHRSDKSKSETKKDESEKLFYCINQRTGRTDTHSSFVMTSMLYETFAYLLMMEHGTSLAP